MYVLCHFAGCDFIAYSLLVVISVFCILLLTSLGGGSAGILFMLYGLNGVFSFRFSKLLNRLSTCTICFNLLLLLKYILLSCYRHSLHGMCFWSWYVLSFSAVFCMNDHCGLHCLDWLWCLGSMCGTSVHGYCRFYRYNSTL